MASDYAGAPQIAPKPELAPAPAPQRDPFAGLKLSPVAIAEPERRLPLDQMVGRFARSYADIKRLLDSGFDELPHQRIAFHAAAKALNAARPGAARDLHSVLRTSPELVDDAAKGRPQAAIGR